MTLKIAVVSNQAFSLLNFRGPLLAEMRRRGYRVIALAPDFDDNSRAALEAFGVEAVDCELNRSGLNPFRELMIIMQLRSKLRDHRPDVSFAYFLKPVIYGTIASWLAGVPRRYGLIAGLGFAFGDEIELSIRRKLVRKVVVKLLAFASSRMTRLGFQNQDDHDQAIALGMADVGRAEMIGATGVDLEKWKSVPAPPGQVSFILVARLLREKGVGDFIVAARSLRAKHPSARFILLGGLDDNPGAITREEVEAWKAEGTIEWPGHVAVQPWLEKSSVFVLPSYYREGVPRSTQEAMAIGRPIITTDAPGCRETVVDGRNGMLIPPRNPLALENAMHYFIENPSEIQRMGMESRKLAEQRFDINLQNSRLLDLMGL